MNVDASAAVSSLALGPSAFEEKLAEATMNLTMKYVMKSQNLFSALDYSRFSPLERSNGPGRRIPGSYNGPEIQ